MNCECVFVQTSDRTKPDKLVEIAHALLDLSEEIEIFPVSVATITTETKAYNTCDEAFGWRPKGKRTILNIGDLVLFVGGKYHYMNKQSLVKRLPKNLLSETRIVFPSSEQDFFDDILFYE